MKPDKPPKRHIEREFGVPIAGEILDPTRWTQTALKSMPAEGRLNWHKLDGLQFIVPSPMTVRRARTKERKLSAHTLNNTGPRRFLVVEFDSGTIDSQAALLLHLAESAPLALAVHSGGKSLHGWFYCAGCDDETLHAFMRTAAELGADPATFDNRSQFVRMPDGVREDGKRQTVFFFNPEVVR